MIFKIWPEGLWVEESENKYCKNHRRPLVTNVTNQAECQTLCDADLRCVGISYSHVPEKNNFCFVCLDSVLSDASNSFGFYKKKGTILLNGYALIWFIYLNFNFSDRIMKYISKLKIFAPRIPANLVVYVWRK